MGPSSPLARLVRAVSVGVWVTFGSVLAHVAGEGAPPSPVALVPSVVLASLVTWWIARRPIGLVAALVLLAVPQLMVHLLAGYIHGHLMVVPSMTMVVAHVVGIAVTGVAIARAENLWWSLWEAWRVRWSPFRGTAPSEFAAVPVLSGAAPVAQPGLRHVVNRRGPPVF